MRLQLILPRIEPTKIIPPSQCPYQDCQGTHFRPHQEVAKSIQDSVYSHATVHRYECLTCHRTFRVYPSGVTHDQKSQRVKGLAVLLYLLGLFVKAKLILPKMARIEFPSSDVRLGSRGLLLGFGELAEDPGLAFFPQSIALAADVDRGREVQ